MKLAKNEKRALEVLREVLFNRFRNPQIWEVDFSDDRRYLSFPNSVKLEYPVASGGTWLLNSPNLSTQRGGK